MNSKMIRYYLSEMAPSAKHGGGLTLLRVLHHELSTIKSFVNIGQFAVDNGPLPDLEPLCISLLRRTETPGFQQLFGSRPSRLLAKLTNPFWIRKLHGSISKIASTDPHALWLICPQSASSIQAWNRRIQPVAANYLTWMMDDHVVRFKDGRLQYPGWFRPLMQRHLKQAAHVFVISPAMASFYEQEFNVQSTVLFGGYEDVDSATVDTIEANRSVQTGAYELGRSGQLEIGYFGAVGGWQLPALELLIKAIEKTGDRLHVYSHQVVQALSSSGQVIFHQPVSSQEVAQRMKSHDVLVLPISFDSALRNMTDLNIATKMSEYLSSERATLVIGPPHAAMVRYLGGRQVTELVLQLSEDETVGALRRLRNAAHRNRLAQDAKQLAREELHIDVMRARVRRAILNVSNGAE